MKLIRIRNNTIYFEFRYTDASTGKRKRCQASTGLADSFENRIQAQQMALEQRNALSQLRPQITKSEPVKANNTPPKQAETSPKTSMLMSDLAMYYQQRKQYLQLAKKSKQLYDMYLRLYVLPHFGHLPLEEIDSDLIEDFEQELNELGRSPKFVKDLLSFVRMLLRLAVKKRFLMFVPHFTVSIQRKERKPKYLKEEERQKLMAYVEQHEALYFPIIEFSLLTGTRMGEARSLTWGDVNLSHDKPSVRIHRTLDIDGEFKGTKTNQERVIPLCHSLAEHLHQQKRQASKIGENDFVFTSFSGGAHSKTTLHKVIVRASRAVGIEGFSFHGLRHTFATIMTNRHGVAIACKLLGHADIKTTMTYYHGDFDALLHAVNDQ